MRSTTILAVRRDGQAAVAGDGQVTLDRANTILKHQAKKVRRIFGGRVLAGFAGSVADALTLFDRFEARLEQSHGNLPRAAVGLAREWRTDRTLRRLEALLLAVDKENLLLVSGSGDVIEPDEPVAAIGSGAGYALAAAKALLAHTQLPAREIALEAMRIASGICVYTNDQITVEEV
ncbi:MAG: ATP-dependent protease subunit HslV [bacterium]|nr:ATP-dependent protease subunit HslV [bacterium]